MGVDCLRFGRVKIKKKNKIAFTCKNKTDAKKLAKFIISTLKVKTEFTYPEFKDVWYADFVWVNANVTIDQEVEIMEFANENKIIERNYCD